MRTEDTQFHRDPLFAQFIRGVKIEFIGGFGAFCLDEGGTVSQVGTLFAFGKRESRIPDTQKE